MIARNLKDEMIRKTWLHYLTEVFHIVLISVEALRRSMIATLLQLVGDLQALPLFERPNGVRLIELSLTLVYSSIYFYNFH